MIRGVEGGDQGVNVELKTANRMAWCRVGRVILGLALGGGSKSDEWRRGIFCRGI